MMNGWTFLSMWIVKNVCRSNHIVQYVEILTKLFLKAQVCGETSGFEAEDGGSKIPILQFADETLVFVNGDKKEAACVRNLLFLFEAVSGLRVNPSKTSDFQVNEVSDWMWTFKINKLWARLVREKYGLPVGDFLPKFPKTTVGCNVRRSL